jgi:hypothetical protein
MIPGEALPDTIAVIATPFAEADDTVVADVAVPDPYSPLMDGWLDHGGPDTVSVVSGVESEATAKCAQQLAMSTL